MKFEFKKRTTESSVAGGVISIPTKLWRDSGYHMIEPDTLIKVTIEWKRKP